MKDVWIAIKGTQTAGGQRDRMEFTTVGHIDVRDGKTFLQYEEGEMLGESGRVTAFLRVADDQMVLQRTGARRSRMIIEKGVRHSCFYNTDYGDFTIGVFGEAIQNTLSPAGGRLYLRYTLDANAGLLSRNEIEISVKEVS